MENIDIEKAEEEEMIELDDQFILRLPKVRLRYFFNLK